MLITKEKYQEISKDWAKHNVVYQKWDRHNVRFPMLLKHIDAFKGKNVLEVGCNAGLAAYYIAPVANSYTGVEEEAGYWKQSLETKKHIESGNAQFHNMSVKTFMKRSASGLLDINFNAIYLSYVLYHFSNKEVRMFQEQVLPKVDTIIIQSRYAKRNKKGRRAHNSYSFWHHTNVKNFLEKNGFETTLEWGPRNKFHFIVGKKIDIVKEIEKINVESVIEHANEVKNNIEKSKLDSNDKDSMKETVEKLKDIAETFKEKPDGNNRSSEVHKEGEGKTTSGRDTRSGERRVAKRKPRGTTQRKTNTQRPRRNVRAKDGDNGSKDILQLGVEKSPKTPVRKKNIQKVGETTQNRSSTKTGEDSSGKDKPAV